jgi:hypothetical protein
MKRLLIIFAFTFLGYIPSAFALLPGESIVFDPVSGDYTFTYWDEQEPASFEKYTLIPSNKIDPVVKSDFKLGGNGVIDYRYTVKNGERSKQPLIVFALDPVSDIISSIPLPKSESELRANINRLPEFFAEGNQAVKAPNSDWDGSADVSLSGADGLRISWLYNAEIETDGLQKNKTQGGFGFSSRDLPGMVMAQLEGNAPMTGYSGEGPDPAISDLSAKLLELEKNTRHVPRNAAVPTIAVPTPFDPAVTLERIQTHMHTWIGMQLLDPAFSAQLDRYFQSAISAYRLNQPKVGKKHIQTMRALIKKEHAGADREDDNDDRGEKGDDDDKNKRALIDKLAARILDFDLKYVTKRMGGDRDD